MAVAHAVLAAKALGVAIDAADTTNKLKAVLNHDYTVRGAGLLLSAVATLSFDNTDAYTPFVDMIDDILGQAEVAGEQLSVSDVRGGVE